ncbi:MAG TPA: hypothetical protein VMF90_17905 [Rhizobiaceae bacterium]|nr:hypothetical protein [Rhizobiaceae bacterium]
MPIDLHVGVLVVGSLDWESKDYGGELSQRLVDSRVAWRSARLRADKRSSRYVKVPIRYGRKSGKRGDSYTMVFSPERGVDLGVGKVITCRRTVSKIADLVDEAEELWAAESEKKRRSRISAQWGCVAIVVSPTFLDHEDADERTKLLEDWRIRTEQEPNYGRLGFSDLDVQAAQGAALVDGRLNISWPKFMNHWPLSLDLILLTATNPELKARQQYPNPQQIAEPWKNADHSYYFRCNRHVGITTPDDDQIVAFLDV